MDLLIIALFFGSLLTISSAQTAMTIFDTASNPLTDTVIGLTSNAAHTACQLFANKVRRYPLKIPTIERMSFQLRVPCGQFDFPLRNAENLRQSPYFDVNKKTIFFVAGWLVEPDMDYIEDLAQAYHCRGDHNFVFVNTGGFTTNLYINAASISTQLGQLFAIGLKNLGIHPKRIHLIGHSLGAQIVGAAGRYYQKITGRRLSRITGLDPARPCFKRPLVFSRLGHGDADFVDIIHSNPYQFGSEEIIGDVDFYAGGLDIIKPGCGKVPILCSHERSLRYYIESVYPTRGGNFLATQCRNFAELQYKQCSGPKAFMGYHAKSNLRGIYFLEVNSRSPYGRNARPDDVFVPYTCTNCFK
ncbi:vitellogenin-3-like [Haematobia irritans]|uniref:vitellogenin-3-like n=1 Tax=Haematobia irritans TaxID=7368 RepID=UPI003F4F739C